MIVYILGIIIESRITTLALAPKSAFRILEVPISFNQ